MSKKEGKVINLAALGALLGGDLENAMVAMMPGGIEAQEALGQRVFVASETLPIKCNFCKRSELEEMGIVFGEPVDDLFVEVQLPEGWKKIPTGHSMWSELVDDKGRKRASIFYKAAFYDHDAFIGTSRRFGYQVQPEGGWDSDFDREMSPRICVVTDCDEVIWRSKPLAPSEDVEWFRLDEHLAPLGKAWLDEHYPDWENTLAYWD